VEAHQIGDVRTAPRLLAVSVPALLPQRLVSAAREVATAAVGEGGAEGGELFEFVTLSSRGFGTL
jgi:hypothetical protein